MDEIAKILDAGEIALIKGGYNSGKMSDKLKEFFLDTYPLTKGWLDELDKLFSTTQPISVEDRERIIIALLASRGRGFQLGLHMYMAVANGVTPEEIAHILFLTGVYTGVDTFAKALAVGVLTMKALEGLVAGGQSPSVDTVFTELQAKLPPW